MDNKRTWIQQAGLTPAKMIVVGVLAAILAGVMYIQFGAAPEESSVATPEPTARRGQAVRPPKSLPAESESTADAIAAAPSKLHVAWPTLELADVVQYDPFALPASFPQPLRAAVDGGLAGEGTEPDPEVARDALEKELQEFRRQLEQLRNQGVHVIIQRRDQYVAMIGDRMIHVGDEINGFKVIAIDADGVRVARDVNQ